MLETSVIQITSLCVAFFFCIMMLKKREGSLHVSFYRLCNNNKYLSLKANLTMQVLSGRDGLPNVSAHHNKSETKYINKLPPSPANDNVAKASNVTNHAETSINIDLKFEKKKAFFFTKLSYINLSKLFVTLF